MGAKRVWGGMIIDSFNDFGGWLIGLFGFDFGFLLYALIVIFVITITVIPFLKLVIAYINNSITDEISTDYNPPVFKGDIKS